MKTKKAEATKRSILKAAGELFMEKSVSKVSVNAIVKKAGVAKGTFYLYYDSKDDLVWDYIDTTFDGANAWLASIPRMAHTKESVEDLVKRIFEYIRSHEKILKIMHDVRFYSFFGTKRMEEKYFKQWVIPITVWLKEGIEDGGFGIEDPDFMAYYLMLTTHHMMDRVLLEEIPFDSKKLEYELGGLLWRLLKPMD